MKIAAIIVLLFVGIITTVAHAQMLLLHVGPGSFGSGGGSANCILVDVGNNCELLKIIPDA